MHETKLKLHESLRMISGIPLSYVSCGPFLADPG